MVSVVLIVSTLLLRLLGRLLGLLLGLFLFGLVVRLVVVLVLVVRVVAVVGGGRGGRGDVVVVLFGHVLAAAVLVLVALGEGLEHVLEGLRVAAHLEEEPALLHHQRED